MQILSKYIDKKIEKLLANPELVAKGANKEILLKEIHEKIGAEIPPRYKDSEYNDIENVNRIIKNGKGVYFYGGAGTGKTHALYGILKALRLENLKDEIRVINFINFL